MSSLKVKIREFLDANQGEGLFPYLYNRPDASFDEQKDWIYYSGPVWDRAEEVAAIEAFVAGRWLPSGEKVAKFERAFSNRFGGKASLMVNSGSSANLVMLAALKKHRKWRDGDEVVLSAVGFPTTLAPVLQNGLKPKLVDITMGDLNFDLDEVEAAIGPRTKAVFLSPVLGNPPDMDRLVDICKRNGIELILDGCDSLGAKWKGKDLTSFACASSCSFYPAHHISTGEGGMVSADDEELIQTARSIAWWGRDCYCVGAANLLKDGTCKRRFSKWSEELGVIDHKYVFTNVGYNLKPLDFQGAIGLEQLAKFDAIHAGRRRNKESIHRMLEEHVEGVRVVAEMDGAEAGWFGVPIVCESPELKEALVAHLESNRVQTRNYFAGNILLHPAYRDLGDAADFPNSNRVLKEVFFIGCHPTYGERTFGYLNTVLAKFSGRTKTHRSLRQLPTYAYACGDGTAG